VSDTILVSTKKILGIAPDDTGFDVDIMTHIDTVLATLNQLGIGPAEGFSIGDGAATWDELLGDDLRLNSVKTYVYLRVRLLFDPPTTSYLINSMQEQVRELEWRLNTYREGTAWTDPNTVSVEG
jgi:hypothetical protein